MRRPILTLLSDFGVSDVYVGVMKGVIGQINPDLLTIDLTHQIPPQNIAIARFHLLNAYPYFPFGSVHVAVVDPGVGSQRRAIAVQTTDAYLVGPDNGLLSGVLNQYPAIAAVELTNPQYWRTPNLTSPTFHGRDIFAAVGAYLASGIPLDHVGQAIALETLVQLPIPTIQQKVDTTNQTLMIQGCIQAIDHFGNLISNIPASMVLGKNWSLIVEQQSVVGSQTYSDVEPGALLSLIGSHGWVEIAVNGGNAQSRLNLNLADSITVVVRSREAIGQNEIG